ncbi:MAG: cytochrome c biogenesis protein ResB [Verrucomicrobia bacterium]|nr:cytochrome c biogenesis protein ResB [Verrucomicrobiota bacterium]
MAAIPQTSMIRTALKLAGSLQLAMILLAVIIVACAVGTVAESRFDTAIAQVYVYDAPWFLAWLLALCINLTCSVVIRYPWKRHQAGFVITHAGIIVLLAGAMIGRIWGMEGSVTLFKGAGPTRHLTMNQTFFDAHALPTGERRSKRLNLEVHPPSPERPVRLKVKHTQISLVDYSKEMGLRTHVEPAKTNGSPALRLVLRSAMAPQPIDHWLLLEDPRRNTLNLGPAQIRFVAATAQQFQAAPAGADSAKTNHCDSTSPANVESRERHFVFAKMPDMSMARVLTGSPTGIKSAFRFDPSGGPGKPEKGSLSLQIGDRRLDFSLQEILGRDVSVEGTGWTLKQTRFLPDFRLEGKEAISASDQPNNPALVFEVAGLSPASSGQLSHNCADHKPGECDHKDQACCPTSDGPTTSPHGAHASNELTIFYDQGRKLSFASSTHGQKMAEGKLEVGKEIPMGLADWQLRVESALESAVIREELVPLTDSEVQPIGAPGVLVQVNQGDQTVRQWIASGVPAEMHVGDELLQLSFGQPFHPLDFDLTLDAFEVERDEGTQNPAGFKSHVRFTDPASKTSLQREIWMNHPADYPDFPGASLLGTTYKFSQASWNPNNLNQTTLQVVRDPGWSLKWIGSLLLCGGIFTMFYLKPHPRLNELRP